MTDRQDDQHHGDQAQAVQVLVSEQLRTARTEVFRAYQRARERAYTLAEDGRREPERQGPTSS